VPFAPHAHLRDDQLAFHYGGPARKASLP